MFQLASSADGIKAILVCIGFGGYLLYSAIRSHRRVRKIEDTPRSKAASAPQGYVELEGFAWPVEKTIPSKVGGEAVYYHFQLQREETRGSGKNRRKTWVTVYERRFSEMFYLVDPTGLVMINPQSGDLDLATGKTTLWKSVSADEQQRILTLIIETQIPSFPPSSGFMGLFASKYRIVEKELLVGSPLYASGDFRTLEVQSTEIKSPGLTSFAKKVFDEASRSFRNVNGFMDTNRDGKISTDERKLGYSTTARVSRVQKATEERDFTLYGELGQSEQNKLFVADAFEADIKARVGRYLWLRFAGGAGLLTIGIVMATAGLNFEKTPERTLASERPNISSKLHQSCVSGNADSCEQLVVKQGQFNLSEEYMKYYRGRACALGRKDYCH